MKTYQVHDKAIVLILSKREALALHTRKEGCLISKSFASAKKKIERALIADGVIEEVW